jgi:lysine 2,3-aminomutase
MVTEYDREHGISYWTKNYRTSIEDSDGALTRQYAYYDPIDTLPESGQRWWRKQTSSEPVKAEPVKAEPVSVPA